MSSIDGNIHSSYNDTELQEINTMDRVKPPPIDTQISVPGTSSSMPPKTPTSTSAPGSRYRDKKIGHRRVHKTGEVTYKKKPTSELMAAIQLGIGQSIGHLTAKPERDLLMQDFAVVDSVFFPSEGSNLTPAHHYSDFRFKAFAPLAFRYFRELFQIQPDDFMLSLCTENLRELSNPGASGSIFYISQDDEFIIKTVQHKEADFLQKLLPGYYMNLNQNPRTTLPKFYGLFCYQCGGKNIRFVVMNNLLPSEITIHEKYDLKGSTYKRKAGRKERAKGCPTLKDLDFIDTHPGGLFLEKDTYDAVIKTLQRDCMVLESFKIMDFSILLGIYNLDYNKAKDPPPEEIPVPTGDGGDVGEEATRSTGNQLQRAKSMRTRVQQYATALESILADTEAIDMHEDDEDMPIGGIPARNARGDRLYLFMGIIDILQSYRLKKKLEHTMKAIVAEGDTISVHRPSFYANRFQTFLSTKVFTKIPSPLRHSPSKRRGQKIRGISQSDGFEERPRDERSRDSREETTRLTADRAYTGQRAISFSDEQGATGGHTDILPSDSTPPPTFAEATLERSDVPPWTRSTVSDSDQTTRSAGLTSPHPSTLTTPSTYNEDSLLTFPFDYDTSRENAAVPPANVIRRTNPTSDNSGYIQKRTLSHQTAIHESSDDNLRAKSLTDDPGGPRETRHVKSALEARLIQHKLSKETSERNINPEDIHIGLETDTTHGDAGVVEVVQQGNSGKAKEEVRVGSGDEDERFDSVEVPDIPA